MSFHPYKSLPQTCFWKTAIADIEPANIEQLWQPKFSITCESKIITVGSCFAQHISRALRLNGFDWIDSEPVPAGLPEADHGSHGYGIFSFRTGNIYTAALLKQWVHWAMCSKQPSTEIFHDNGRYFDPFRPSIPPEGYASPKELFQARKVTLAAIADAVRQADVLIFTLGLTEAWLNSNGDVYPMCPGTVRGEFSAADHIFHNFNEQEVVRDISEALDGLRKLNPALKLLLTVSPVPLTATASGQHVLTANTYSKSVLRSAAGRLAQTMEEVDYFPSYELIATPPFRGRFFEKNMRSVTLEGVAFVMSQFFSAIGNGKKSASLKPSPGTRAVDSAGKSGTEICDDIILETWSDRKTDDLEEPPNILLIGDSQMGMVAKALDAQGIRYAGGAIMRGSEWHNKLFLLDENHKFRALPHEATERWDGAFKSVANQAPGNICIITNIGMHANALLSKTEGIFQFVIEGPRGCEVTSEFVIQYLNSARQHHFKLLESLVERGYKVIWVSDFPTATQETLQLQLFVEKALGIGLEAIGASTFLASEWIENMGGLKQEFRSAEIDKETGKPDVVHGSIEYYKQLSKAIFEKFKIVPTLR